MGKNLAISIGINKYDFLGSLKYAKRDAELMQEFLRGASFEQVFFFSDDSPDFHGISTRPSRANLRRLLRQISKKPIMEAGDNLWFFFSGHGMQYDERDYLMPCDGDAEDVEHTAIPIDFVTECLRGCGAGNVILMLDACRYQESKSGLGIGNKTAEIARQQGVITFFSCSPNQLSYEIETLQQGIFTKAVLEGLGFQGKYATVGRLDRYLSARVPELIREHKGEQVRQTPYCIAESVTQYNLIICPQYARFPEISILKNDACEAEFHKDYDLAEQLWIQVLAASTGDRDAINGIKRIAIKQIENERYSQDNSVSEIDNPVSAIEIGDEEENLVFDFALSEEEAAVSDFDMADDDDEAAVSDFDMADDDDEAAVSDFDMDDDDEEELAVSNSNAKRSESLLSSKSVPVVNPIPTEPDVPLKSERGVDYTNLRDLLAAKKWEEADDETARVMLKVGGKNEKEYLDEESIDKFPCEDLRTIDQLWVKYSNGRFGFSVQKRIYQTLGGTREYDEKIWQAFGDQVGWRENNFWLYYQELSFLNAPPDAHFPVVWGWWWWLECVGRENVVCLLSRRDL